MSLKKSGLSMIVGGLIAGAAASASAQTVESAKTQQYSLLPNAYGSIDLRHYYFKALNENVEGKSDDTLPAVQSRVFLGSTFMDGKLDMTAVLAATARPQTEKVSQRRPELDIKYTAISGKYGEFSPELYVFAAHQGDPVENQPGLFMQVMYPIETSLGTITPNATAELLTKFSSQTRDATVENESTQPNSALGLTDDGTRNGGKEDLNFYSEYSAGVTLKSGAFGAEISQWMDQVYIPRYVAQEDGSIEMSRPPVTTVSERLKLSYKITDKTTLSQELWYQQGGLYETQFNGADENKGLYSFNSIAKVTYSM